MRTYKLSAQKSQQGATLILVLFVLLLVTVVGVVAIRVALTSLNIATNSQVSHLNFQSADTPIDWIRRANPAELTSFTNIIGAALNEHQTNPGGEYIFCFKPTSTTVKFAQTQDASLLKAGSDDVANVEDGGTRGFCDLTSDFGSSRQAVITQVAVSVPTDSDTGAPGSYLPRGTNLTVGSSLPTSMTSVQRIRMTTTSMLPAYSSTLLSTIQTDCLSTTNAKISDNMDPTLSNKQTLADCLASKGVPVSSQVQEFNYASSLNQVRAPGV